MVSRCASRQSRYRRGGCFLSVHKLACLEGVEHTGQVAAGNIAAGDSLEEGVVAVALHSPVEAVGHTGCMPDSTPAVADIELPALAEWGSERPGPVAHIGVAVEGPKPLEGVEGVQEAAELACLQEHTHTLASMVSNI